ncbi:nucleotidyltransferase substrate binding protein [Avibacterium paragallinarum]|uniref:nucleotidyltransferase substrate binding protein n=1 Tax=Avibacterium paragallinarum TaxID=728 RepID=UPI0021F742F4|nr:nucleotidyltransferase substrate binding protein [Avibacterium paragallinarum]UXN34607.1 nucleotidyltransferase substrate binding protein [Avibacterium paragallinarum]
MEQLDLSALEKAFHSLEMTLAKLADKQWFAAQENIVQDTLIAGCIQKFEFVYELSIKMMKRQLKLIAEAPDEIDGADFRDILRLSAKAGLIEQVEDWQLYRKMRNITSHTYDQNKAQQVYGQMIGFLASAKNLLNQLQQRNNDD